MNKKIIAILAAVGLFSSGAYAGGSFQEISVNFDAVQKIMIYGQDKTPKDLKAFIYNDVTYVPLRYVSDQLKVPVSWDGSTGTVYLGEVPVKSPTGSTMLTDLKIDSTYNAGLYRINNKLESSFNLDVDAMASFLPTYQMRIMEDPDRFKATAYSSGLALKVYDQTDVYYRFLGGYKTLKGKIGFDTVMNGTISGDLTVTFIGDGKQIGEYTLNNQKRFSTVEVPVAGVDVLTIKLTSKTDKFSPFVNLVDMILE